MQRKAGEYMAVGYDGSIRIDTNINSKGFNAGINQVNKGLTGITSSLKRLAVAAGIAFGIGAVISFGKASVKATTDLKNAMIGLKSIMDGQGRSFNNAKKFINDYVSDGLVPATNAITAYKNLASRGYSDTQIEQVLVALKDSAAFGRQASYSLGDAVTAATEGLKNENSILVDNAGVTKNVAKMWEDYAKSIGTTANNLSKQQKIQAEVTGILEETKFQTGDAAKIANNYSGEVLKLGFNFNNLKIAVGNALLPIAWAVLPSINAIIAALTRLANVFAQVTTAIFGKQTKQQDQIAKSGVGAAKAQDKLADSTKKAGKEAKEALADFDDLNLVTKGTADSSTDAAAGIDSDLGLGDITTGGEIGADVTVSPAVQKAVDSLMKMLEPLKLINFDNLNNAFDRLKKAVEPITKTIFSGLEWAYLNLFVPLAKWTIEDYLPSWLDAFSATLGVLSSVIDALKPLAIWLWEQFLKPMAEWTGGIIVQVLYYVSDALNNLSDWINNNQELVKKIALVVLAVYAVVKAFEAFTSISAFITGAISAIKIAMASINPVAVLIVAGIALIVAAVIDLWEKSEEFRNNVTEAVTKIGDILNAVWETIIKPVFDTFMQTVDWLWEKHLKPLLDNVFRLVQDFIQFAVVIMNEFILPLVSAFIDVFGPSIANVFQTIFSILGTFLATATDVINGVVTVLRGIIEFLTGVFTGDWKKAWNGIVKVFKGIFEGIGGIIKGVVNIAIDMINGMIRAITSGLNFIIKAMNKLSFNIPDWVPAPFGGKTWGLSIKELTAYNIPKLATGAVIPPNSEFLAILGDQKSGKNIETPEGLLRQILREELGSMGQQQMPDTQVNMYLDNDVIGRAFVKWVNEQVNRTGELPFSLGRL